MVGVALTEPLMSASRPVTSRTHLPVVTSLHAADDAGRSSSQGRVVEVEIRRTWQEREVRISIAPTIAEVAADIEAAPGADRRRRRRLGIAAPPRAPRSAAKPGPVSAAVTIAAPTIRFIKTP
jgi:hypothetical protein